MYGFFKCANCGGSMPLPACPCGHVVPFAYGVYKLTDAPYIVNDDSAEVKYIGYEDIGEAYSSGAAFTLASEEEKHNRIAEIIDGGILLDLGCGDGLFTVPLLKRGLNVIAMDISDKMLALLYKRADNAGVDTSNLVACRANALTVPLVDNSVDAVIANSMLHLISKPEMVVSEIHRVLKKGGKFISLEDKPTTGNISDRNSLTPQEAAENARHEEMVGYIHRRYFEILKAEYDIHGTRHSWKFDKDSVYGGLFAENEKLVVPLNKKIRYTLEDTFILRMRGKGYSDQSDVPRDIHENVFARVMAEFIEKYGNNAPKTIYTGYENDVEIAVYTK